MIRVCIADDHHLIRKGLRQYIEESSELSFAGDLVGVGKGKKVKSHEELSDREYQVLLPLGSGQTVREVSEHLHLSISTVHTYRRRLMEKLSLRRNEELIRYVQTTGSRNSGCNKICDEKIIKFTIL